MTLRASLEASDRAREVAERRLKDLLQRMRRPLEDGDLFALQRIVRAALQEGKERDR